MRRIVSRIFKVCPVSGRIAGIRFAKNPFNVLFFPIVGLAALAWFILRVIPKPSRAGYPCQRVAAPIAATFVAWVIGLGGSLLALGKARNAVRQARYLVAAICVIAGVMTIVLTTNIGSSDAQTGALSTSLAPLAPNNPIGAAKGTNPGRVVWVHDPLAVNQSHENHDGTYWYSTSNNDQTRIDTMVARSIRELTGSASN